MQHPKSSQHTATHHFLIRDLSHPKGFAKGNVQRAKISRFCRVLQLIRTLQLQEAPVGNFRMNPPKNGLAQLAQISGKSFVVLHATNSSHQTRTRFSKAFFTLLSQNLFQYLKWRYSSICKGKQKGFQTAEIPKVLLMAEILHQLIW